MRPDPRRVAVTGEGGDQLFGSDKMEQCFFPAVDADEKENYFAAGANVV